MPSPRPRDLIRLSLLYLPMTLFWTAMQLQLLPERIEVLARDQKGLYLALIGSVGALAASFCIFVVGPLSDHTTHRSGRRFPWVVGGIWIGAFGVFLFSFAHSLPVLMLSFVLVRLGFATVVAAYEAILPDRVPRSFQSRASGWCECSDICGQFIGIGLTFLMVRGTVNSLFHSHLLPAVEADRAVFLICMGSILALIGVLALNLPWIRGEALPREAALPWRQALVWSFQWRPSQAPNFFRLYLSRCVLNLGTFTGIEFLRYFVAEAFATRGIDVAHEVMMIGIAVTVGGVLGALVGGWLGDFVSKRNLLFVFCSIAALAAAGMCLTSSIGAARLIAFCFGVGFSAINAVDWAFATNLVPPGQEARYLSIFQTCFYLPQILVLSVGGVFGQHFGYRALFWTIPAWLVAGMLLLSRVRELDEVHLARLE